MQGCNLSAVDGPGLARVPRYRKAPFRFIGLTHK